jgi:hypothetical protein
VAMPEKDYDLVKSKIKSTEVLEFDDKFHRVSWHNLDKNPGRLFGRILNAAYINGLRGLERDFLELKYSFLKDGS